MDTTLVAGRRQASSTPAVGGAKAALTGLIPVLAVAAGAIHLAHNYLPMGGGPRPSGGVHPAGGPPPGGAGGLMSLIGPHVTQVMILNFAGFIGLALLFVLVRGLRGSVRAAIDVLLIALSAATLYAWNAMGRSNPHGLGTWALLVEGGLIVLAAAHLALIGRRAQP